MNIQNLIKARKHMATVPAKLIAMEAYFYDQETPLYVFNKHCGSPACVIGHCVKLDEANAMKAFVDGGNNVMFPEWSESWFDEPLESDLWNYLFSADWMGTTKKAILARMDYVIEHGEAPDGRVSKFTHTCPACEYESDLSDPKCQCEKSIIAITNGVVDACIKAIENTSPPAMLANAEAVKSGITKAVEQLKTAPADIKQQLNKEQKWQAEA